MFLHFLPRSSLLTADVFGQSLLRPHPGHHTESGSRDGATRDAVGDGTSTGSCPHSHHRNRHPAL